MAFSFGCHAVWVQIKKIDTPTFYSVLVLVVMSTLGAGYLTSRYLSLRAEISRHGFDRALVLRSSNPPKAPFSIHDGALALLSRGSAKELASLPEFDAVDATSIFLQDLQLPDGQRLAVHVLSMTPRFSATYALGDPALMNDGNYVPSAQLRKALGLPREEIQGVLLPSPELIAGIEQSLPAAYRSTFSWDKARLPIRISAGQYIHPAGSERFDTMLFTTSLERTVSLPNMTIGAEVDLFVHVAPGVDVDQAANRLAAFVNTATPAEPGMQLAVRPASDYFARDFNLVQLRKWQRQLELGTAALGVALALVIAVVKLPRIRHETMLRRAAGASLERASWLSFRPVAYGIFAGVVLGVAWSLGTVYFSCPNVFRSSLGHGVGTLGLAMASVLGIYGICLASGRSSALSVELNRGSR